MEQKKGFSFLTLAQLLVSGFGAAGFFFLTAIMVFTGGFSVLGSPLSSQEIYPVFSIGWISLALATVNLLSAVFALLALIGKPVNPPQIPFLGFLLNGSWIIVALVLMVGALIIRSPFAPFFLPLFQILALGLPCCWLVYTFSRKITTTSPQRALGLFSFTSIVNLPFIVLVELLLVGILVFLLVLVIMLNPAWSAQFQLLLRETTNIPPDAENLSRSLEPYLRNPAIVGGLLLLVAIIIPAIEELLKPLGLLFLVKRRFTPADGFTAGLICGATFAFLESLGALSNPAGEQWPLLVVARLGTTLLHTANTALIGWAFARAWNKKKYGLLALVYLSMTGIHALWNAFSVFTFIGGTLGASDSNALWQVASYGSPMILIFLCLLEFVLLLVVNHKLRSSFRTNAVLAATFD